MKNHPSHARLGTEPEVAGSKRNKKQENWRSLMATFRSDAGAVSSRYCTVPVNDERVREERPFCRVESIKIPY